MIFEYPVLPPGLDVSRETCDRLQSLLEMVQKWNRSINLVSPATLAETWHRHIADSAQIWPLGAGAGNWIDIGSGGGFPGLVIAAIAAEKQPDLRITLVESDSRKCVFLREASRDLGVSATVVTERIESLPPAGTQVLSARALAPVTELLGHAHRHLAPNGVGLFMKGRSAHAEVQAARQYWAFDCMETASATDAEAVILSVRRVAHA